MIADFRSDTVTKPTTGMLNAMLKASVGDDVFGEDSTVNLLEKRMADLFGMEAALWCVTGTQANQVAITLQAATKLFNDGIACIFMKGGIAYDTVAEWEAVPA